ncbi:unnamed protein product [Urochloa humidicola]
MRRPFRCRRRPLLVLSHPAVTSGHLNLSHYLDDPAPTCEKPWAHGGHKGSSETAVVQMQAAPQDGGAVLPCERSCVHLQWHLQVQHQTEANQHQVLSPCLLQHARSTHIVHPSNNVFHKAHS